MASNEDDNGGEGHEGGGEPPRPPLTFHVGAPLDYRLGAPVDPDAERERTRTRLALILALLLVAVALLLILLTALKAIDIEEAKDLAASVLSPVVAVTGTALGFYFSSHRIKD